MNKIIFYNRQEFLYTLFVFIFFFTHIIILNAADCGDVNNDLYIDIIDALLIAQYYADMDPDNFDPEFANVDGDYTIDILDALLVAQYSIGRITEFPGACQTPEPGETPAPTTPPPTPEPVNPLNLDDITEFIKLSTSEEERLISNGFLVLDPIRQDTITVSYRSLTSQNTVSTFLTTDALLHIFHITYAHMLEVAEKDYLYQKLQDILTWFEADVALEYANIAGDAYCKEACRRLWIFAAVAKALIHGEESITGNDAIESEVNGYLGKITSTEREPEYSYYKPRSHYVDDDQLTSYFWAMTWCERHKFSIEDPSQTEAEYNITAAAIMASIILNNSTLQTAYEWFYTILSKLKNTVISVTPLGVDRAMKDEFDTEYQEGDYSLLEIKANRERLQSQLLHGNYAEDQSIQFLGEHKSLDLMVFKQTTHSQVENRKVPGGLDVASTVLNSQAAYDEFWFEKYEYPALEEQLDTLRALFNGKPQSEWIESISNYWLYTLRTLSSEPAGVVPPFMKTGIWEREKLNTQLASWAELHSDSIYIPSTPTPPPTPEPTSTPSAAVGNVSIVPGTMNIESGSEFTTEVQVDTGSQKVAAYGIKITYDPDFVSVNTRVGSDGVTAGADGFVSAVNPNTPGVLAITGFDTDGKGPGTELQLLIVSWIAGSQLGQTALGLEVETLADEKTNTIGSPNGIGATLIISSSALYGDVNNDGEVDIVDALLTAQYYVGLNPGNFDSYLADANCDGIIDIIDALFIAKFYVGLIDKLGCETPTPEPTATPTPPDDTPAPTPTAEPVTPTPTPSPTPTPPVCFVEPYPGFYERLQGMCDQVDTILYYADINTIHRSKFKKISNWSATFNSYALKQLGGELLTPEENAVVHNFSSDVGLFFSSPEFVPEYDSKAQVVSSVYTYEDGILHEAVGYINPVIVIYPLPGETDGIAAVGYVLSYYEFSEAANTRLTDQEWIDKITTVPPPRPSWTEVFVEY